LGLFKPATKTEVAIDRLREFGPTCSSRELASVIGGQPYYYNVQAKKGTLPFQFIWRGRALRVSTESVIKFLRGENANV